MKKLLILSLGGTILSQFKENTYYGTPSLEFNDLAKKLELSPHTFDFIEISKKISHNIEESERQSLIQIVRSKHNEYEGIIILYGTNTLEDFAFHLAITCGKQAKILITGALYPFGHPLYDGIDNLNHAISFFRKTSAAPNGVYCVFHSRLIGADFVRKKRSGNIFLMESLKPECDGVFEKEKIIFPATLPSSQFSFAITTTTEWVPIVYADYDLANTIRAVMERKPRGIVLAGYGNGYIDERLALELREFEGIKIRASRCGDVCEGDWKYDGKYNFFASGVLTPGKAQVLLSLLCEHLREKEAGEIMKLFVA